MSETDSDLDFESADEDAEFASNIGKDVESEKVARKTASNCNQSAKVLNEAISKVKESIEDEPNDKNTGQSPSTSTEVLEGNVYEGVNKTFDKLTKEKISSKDIKTKSEELLDTKEDADKNNEEQDKRKSTNSTADVPEAQADHNSVEPEAQAGHKRVEAEFKPEAQADHKSVEPEAQAGHKSVEPEFKPEAQADHKRVEPELKPEAQADHKSVDSEVKPEAQAGHKRVDPEKPRVVLRIEKRKQQKSQFSKEASVEKEKASDLVNILREEPPPPQFSSWGFSSWGTSLLSTAASSVSTFSSQVTQGIETVFETVESSLGAPAPEELATTLNEKKKEKDNNASPETESENDTKAGLLPDVSSWTKVFENTGSKVLFGGLDTLELIGKKTMDMLTEGDPGLRKKRAAFSDKVNIAELLREARAQAEEKDKRDGVEKDTIDYSQIFDEKQGLVHLEALEMLSNQSQVKLQRLLMRHSKNVEVKKRLEEIKSICENIPSVDDLSDCENFEDFETIFKKHTLELSLPVNVENILKVQRRINDDITKYESITKDSKPETKEVFCSAICSLAEFTAKCIETFHKISELIIVQSKLEPDVEHCVTNLTGLTTVMCIEVNNFSAKYHKCLETMVECNEGTESSDELNVTTMATNLYVEAANSNKYIQDAYLMLVPVLQVCLLETLD